MMEVFFKFDALNQQGRYFCPWFCERCYLSLPGGSTRGSRSLSWGPDVFGREVVAGEKRLGQALRGQIPALQPLELVVRVNRTHLAEV